MTGFVNPVLREPLLTRDADPADGRDGARARDRLPGQHPRGSNAEYRSQRRTDVRQLEEFRRERNIQAFPLFGVAERLEQGVSR
jgi:hypothetical protein